MFADPQRHAAMARARDDNAVHMTGPVRLDVDAGRQVSGVVMYARVYRFGTPATRSAWRAALQRWIYAPLDMHAFVDAVLRASSGASSLTNSHRGGEWSGEVMASHHATPLCLWHWWGSWWAK